MIGSRLLVSAVVGIATLAGTPSAHAEDPQPPLMLPRVLDAVRASHPGIEAADQGVEKAEAKRFAARGAWDPGVRVSSVWSPVGYYENGQVDTLVRQATPAWGLGLYAGYRVGWGSYPAYYGDLETLSGGEVRAGIDLPLWKDGPIDARRAELRTSRLEADGAVCKRQSAELKLAQQAAAAYWRWVATGLEVQIQRDLLAVAQARDDGLRQQADLGSIPAILVIDNERLVLDRQSKLVDAQQDFSQATVALSLFLRDGDRQPVRVGEARLPPAIPDAALSELGPEQSDLDRALGQRPELCRLERERAAAEVRTRLARNQRAPAINVQAFVSRDFGRGPADLAPAEFGAGVTVEMPLLLTKARGDYQAAKAEVQGLSAELRGLRDRVVAEVRRARVDLVATRQQVVIARRQVEVARRLADAEREKLREGASDLVVVNLRELAAADAARLEVEALAAYQQARADYLTALGDGL